MKQDAAPVDLEELRRLVAELPLDDNKRNDYIAARWLKYVEWWDFRARGDIWREKRAAAEIIKSEGFSFFQLADTYSQFGSHKEAYRTFAQNVEQLIRNEIKEYIKTVTPKSDTRPTPNKDEVSTVV
jgi:hypothetical protein